MTTLSNYFIIFFEYIISNHHMGPPNPEWWVGRSLSVLPHMPNNFLLGPPRLFVPTMSLFRCSKLRGFESCAFISDFLPIFAGLCLLLNTTALGFAIAQGKRRELRT